MSQECIWSTFEFPSFGAVKLNQPTSRTVWHHERHEFTGSHKHRTLALKYKVFPSDCLRPIFTVNHLQAKRRHADWPHAVYSPLVKWHLTSKIACDCICVCFNLGLWSGGSRGICHSWSAWWLSQWTPPQSGSDPRTLGDTTSWTSLRAGKKRKCFYDLSFAVSKACRITVMTQNCPI